MTTSNHVPSFWPWFFRGTQGLPGYRLLINWYLLLHLVAGVLIALLSSVELDDAARTVLLPLAGVFVGVSFAWGANATALLQTQEVEEIGRRVGGLEEFAFAYQLAMLSILSSLVLWGLAGLRVFADLPLVWSFLVETLFYSTISVTIRESWHVALGAQMFLLSRNAIRNARAEAETRLD